MWPFGMLTSRIPGMSPVSILHRNNKNITGSGGTPIIFVTCFGINLNTHGPHLTAPAKTLPEIRKFLPRTKFSRQIWPW